MHTDDRAQRAREREKKRNNNRLQHAKQQREAAVQQGQSATASAAFDQARALIRCLPEAEQAQAWDDLITPPRQLDRDPNRAHHTRLTPRRADRTRAARPPTPAAPRDRRHTHAHRRDPVRALHRLHRHSPPRRPRTPPPVPRPLRTLRHTPPPLTTPRAKPRRRTPTMSHLDAYKVTTSDGREIREGDALLVDGNYHVTFAGIAEPPWGNDETGEYETGRIEIRWSWGATEAIKDTRAAVLVNER